MEKSFKKKFLYKAVCKRRQDMTRKEQIGQRLVTGFPGTELTDDYKRMH